MYYYCPLKSDLGTLHLYADDQAILGLYFDQSPYQDGDLINQAILDPDQGQLREARAWLRAYFKGDKPDIKGLSLNPRPSTPFRGLVWDLLLTIPYGEVVGYKDLATEAGRILGKEKMSAQAVGGALGHNPISILIPCHRVIGKDGALVGYGGGLDRKQKLLEIEKVSGFILS